MGYLLREGRSGRHRVITATIVSFATVVAMACTGPTGPSMGTWSAADPPAEIVSGARFTDVSCTTSTWCVAVGVHVPSGDRSRPLAMSWDGSEWTLLPDIPIPPDRLLYMDSGEEPRVACGAADSCVASLTADICPVDMAVIMCAAYDRESVLASWDGTRWTVNPTRSSEASDENPIVEDVACGGPRSCLAVGALGGAAGAVMFAEVWDGTSWAAAAPPPARGGALSTRLTCATPTFCARLETTPVSGGAPWPFSVGSLFEIEIWNGTSWTTTPDPLPVRVAPTGERYHSGRLQDIHCSTPADCVVAGSTIVRWNGSRWTEVRPPAGVDLATVACSAGDRCLAIAADDDLAGDTAVRAADGPRPGWSLTTSPSQPAGWMATARAVSCRGDRCLIVGDAHSDTASRAIAFTYRFAT